MPVNNKKPLQSPKKGAIESGKPKQQDSKTSKGLSWKKIFFYSTIVAAGLCFGVPWAFPHFYPTLFATGLNLISTLPVNPFTTIIVGCTSFSASLFTMNWIGKFLKNDPEDVASQPVKVEVGKNKPKDKKTIKTDKGKPTKIIKEKIEVGKGKAPILIKFKGKPTQKQFQEKEAIANATTRKLRSGAKLK